MKALHTDRNKVRVVGYSRVSTKEQASSGVSIEAQDVKLAQYCSVFDLDLVSIQHDRGRSAKTLDRDGLQSALGMLRSGQADALLVVKLDRLVRSTVGLGHLVEEYFSSDKSWSLLSVAENIDTRTAAGRLVANVLASVGQWEREAIVERTRDALAHLRALGVVLGGVSFGKRRGEDEDEEGRRLIEDVTRELETILLIRGWWDTGLSLRKICAKLHEQELAPKNQHQLRRPSKADDQEKKPTRGVWHPKVVRSILLRDGVLPAEMQARRCGPRAA